jgi:predicted amidohydrolase YtcJ
MNRGFSASFVTKTLSALVSVLALTGAGCVGAPPPPAADLVLRGGRIVTLDDATPEAQALAARNGIIVAVGSEADVAAHIGPSTQVIDLAGQLAMPGFIEGHGHFVGIGENKTNLDLLNTTSWDQIIAAVRQAVEKARPGQWIIGRGWHQEKWTALPQPSVEGFPTHQSLDRVSPNHPVLLTHASGHASFVNARAMALSNITRSTPNPSGGEILKDRTGEPTGLLRETASALVKRGAGEPPPTAEEADARATRVLELADQEVVSKGITSFQDAGEPFAVIDRMKRMIDARRLRVRLWVMARTNDNRTLAPGLDRARVVGYGNHQLTVRAIKVQIDGALGSRGAWLLQPYADKPESTGLNTTPVDSVTETAQLAIDHNYQLAIHAIGDRANRELLDIYEAAFKTNARNGQDLRWRIEHAQHLSAADIPRFGQLGVIASMQAIHATSDAVFVLARLGEDRARDGAYVWRKLLASGAVVTNGTDAPVEDVDPIPNYYAAVTRKLADGRAFYDDQKMSRIEALRSYTIRNAFAAFEEDIKGTLTVGKLADITVLSKDITTVPDDEIRKAKVAYTIIGGKVAYKP